TRRPAEAPPAPPRAAREPVRLEERVLEQHLLLAEAQEPAEQLKALGKMAADLRDESLHEARRQKAEDVSFLVWLYRRVLVEGVVGCAVVRRADERALLTPVVADLKKAEAEAGRLARGAAPQLAGPLRLLQQTAGAAARALQADPAAADLEKPPARPPAEP